MLLLEELLLAEEVLEILLSEGLRFDVLLKHEDFNFDHKFDGRSVRVIFELRHDLVYLLVETCRRVLAQVTAQVRR